MNTTLSNEGIEKLREPRKGTSYTAKYNIAKYKELYRHRDGKNAAPLWQWMVTNGKEEFQFLFFNKWIVKVEKE